MLANSAQRGSSPPKRPLSDIRLIRKPIELSLSWQNVEDQGSMIRHLSLFILLVSADRPFGWCIYTVNTHWGSSSWLTVFQEEEEEEEMIRNWWDMGLLNDILKRNSPPVKHINPKSWHSEWTVDMSSVLYLVSGRLSAGEEGEGCILPNRLIQEAVAVQTSSSR